MVLNHFTGQILNVLTTFFSFNLAICVFRHYGYSSLSKIVLRERGKKIIIFQRQQKVSAPFTKKSQWLILWVTLHANKSTIARGYQVRFWICISKQRSLRFQKNIYC